MKIEPTIVPKDKCPLDFIAEMGERTKNALIFLHHNIIENLKDSDGVSVEEGRKSGTLVFAWEATEDYPETKIVVDICGIEMIWKPVILISACDIAFTIMPPTPEEIYFLQMEE